MMTKQHIHESHAPIVKRLKRAEGHLRCVVERFDDGRSCLELAQQVNATEKAITKAKRTLVHDYVDTCLDVAVNGDSSKPTKNVPADFKAIARYL
nr:metal-sensing transcriptional repressor [Nitrobacter vulgaris]